MSWQEFYYYAEISGMSKLIKMGYDPGEILEDLADIHMVEVILRRVAGESILEEIEGRDLE